MIQFSNIEITTNNQNNPEYEAIFDKLINEVFGFSFDTWLERKLWSEQYVSYSIIDEGKMLANLCIHDTNMIVCGKPFRAVQLGAVCTSNSVRGKGLSRRLMERIMSDYADIPMFLFANNSVLDFYPRFGFRQVQIFKPVLEEALNGNQKNVVKLNVDDPIIRDAINNRSEYSKTLDCLNTGSIQIFHLLKDYPDDIYHLPALDVIIVAYEENNRLFIADIIAKKPVTFDLIKPELPFEKTIFIEFGFNPDWLDLTPAWEPVPMTDVMFFIKGSWNLPDTFRFPATSET